LIGGYKPGPTHALLRHVAWEYRQVVYEGRTLATAVEEFTRRIAELEGQVAQLGGTSGDGAGAENAAEALLAEAQRAADELRTATRAECEAMLEQARTKSLQMETANALRSGGDESKLVQLHQLRERVRGELRATLESVTSLDTSTRFEAETGDPNPNAVRRNAPEPSD
jgi:cell division septum initiation protein DivIVA